MNKSNTNYVKTDLNVIKEKEAVNMTSFAHMHCTKIVSSHFKHKNLKMYFVKLTFF